MLDVKHRKSVPYDKIKSLIANLYIAIFQEAIVATVAPSINWRELRRISRTIGALLTIVGGVVVLLQIVLGGWSPVPHGFDTTSATVISREQVGTFQNPAFLVTLQYATNESDTDELLRSGRRVEYELYRNLPHGTEVTIQYNLDKPFEWRITQTPVPPNVSDYGLGLLMIVLGTFSLIFPFIVRLASREDDFVQPQRVQVN